MSIRALHLIAAAVLLSSPLLAQGPAPATPSRPAAPADSTDRVAKLAPVGITATRRETSTMRTAVPVLIVDSTVIRAEYPNGVGDLFRNLPGVDVTGVGTNQARLMIRGQRGQRILLAEDGMRLNNARRQQDFGELPALTDVNDVDRVEVVRGPASVLYGTDAIGGVVNQRTLALPARGSDGVWGTAFYRRSEADGQDAGHVRVSAREGRFAFAVSSTERSATTYFAPAGRFGDLRLSQPAEVRDAGVRDANYAVQLAYDLSDVQNVALRLSRYDARSAGFGYVDPRAWGDSSGVIVRLLYPDQTVDRAVATWQHTALASRFADRVSVTASTGGNDRIFRQAIDIPFTPTAGMTIRSENVTNIGSLGVRAEATKIVGGGHILTYGIDWYRDRSTNTDSSETYMFGFGPPSTQRSTTPNVPNATYATGGAFVQGQFFVGGRLELGAGARAQAIRSDTRETPGLPSSRAGVSSSNSALVGQVNAQWHLRPDVNVVASVGRAFRAANLIERYFEGATPEGNGYQVASPDLRPETSLNFDVGVKLRRQRFSGELTLFSNRIRDGIRIAPRGDTIGGFPAYQNENVDRLRDLGVEALAELALGRGLSILGSVTTLDSKNVDSSNPVGDSYGSKVGAELGWTDRAGRGGLRYEVRHQGTRKDIALAGSPVGDRLPAFTVHAIRGELRLPMMGSVRPTLNMAVTNLTNVLYSEASNTSFFRPEPPRSVLAALRFDF